MSASEALAMPITATLSVTRTFISAPSRDFTVSTGPSTASMAPRMRTAAGACADAAVANSDAATSEAAKARGNNDETFMIVPLRILVGGSSSNTPGLRAYSGNNGTVTSDDARSHYV